LKIEWISDTSGNNLHRNVIFHENGAREFVDDLLLIWSTMEAEEWSNLMWYLPL
jgi:hypothetical protein